jgi:cyclopropane fatty-acyl-phospholipid synthase-like methyltransferase
MNEQVKDSYNKVADNYSKNRDLFKNDKYLEMLAKDLTPGSTILDLGCGAGIPVDKYFIDRGFKIIGLDISDRQIELARQNLPEGEFQVGDMSDLQPGAYQVDAVVSFYAIFHTPKEEHPIILDKINSFLPTNGRLLISMGASEWEGKEDFHGAEMWWSHYGSDHNTQMVKNAGFEIVLSEVDTTGGENHLMVLAVKK